MCVCVCIVADLGRLAEGETRSTQGFRFAQERRGGEGGKEEALCFCEICLLEEVLF